MDFRRVSQLRCRPKTQIGPMAFEVSHLQEVIISRISRGLIEIVESYLFYFGHCYKNVRATIVCRVIVRLD